MLHANAALTPRQRLRLARLVVEEKWPKSRAAEYFGVAWTTADRWARRYEAFGKDGMADRSSRPHVSPAKTDQATIKRIVSLRLRKRWAAVRLATETGVAPATAGAVLRRCQIGRLSRLERRTGRSSATSTLRPATCSTSTSRSWATSRPAVAGASSAGRRAGPTGTSTVGGLAAATAIR